MDKYNPKKGVAFVVVSFLCSCFLKLESWLNQEEKLLQKFQVEKKNRLGKEEEIQQLEREMEFEKVRLTCRNIENNH